ncbi:MAG: beta-N-acetylhexosaminidase [Kiritimatiellales bacterium]|nr:beta-N-acetylhexosaminidase [Kiritimatiellales bacterium]
MATTNQQGWIAQPINTKSPIMPGIIAVMIKVALISIISLTFGLNLFAQMVPCPKKVTPYGTSFSLGKTVTIKYIDQADSYSCRCARLLQEELALHGIKCDVLAADTVEDDGAIYLMDKSNAPQIAEKLLKTLRLENSAPLHEEGYVLDVRTNRTVCIGNDSRGMLYGMWSLSQLFSGNPVQEQQVMDYPDLAMRHSHLNFHTANLTIDDYILLCRTLSMLKYNGVCLSYQGNIELKNNPLAYDHKLYCKQTEVRRLVDIAKNTYRLDIYPEVKSLGKAQWSQGQGNEHNMWLKNDPSLADMFEPAIEAKKLGYYKARGVLQRTFKLNDPRFYPLLFGVYDELIDVFDHPKFFNIGVEEPFDGPMLASEETGKSAEQLLKEHIIKLNDFLQARGITAMLWADIFLPKDPWAAQLTERTGLHGGAPWFGERVINELPKDMIILDWHYGSEASKAEVASGIDYSTFKYFQDMGFDVLGVPWSRTNNILAHGASASKYNSLGIMGSSWGLGQKIDIRFRDAEGIVMTAEAAWGPHSAQKAISSYDPMSFIQEYVHLHGGISNLFYEIFMNNEQR